MSDVRKLPWRRLISEFFVIVVGVLVALGVDRWVSGFDQREQERTYLTALLRDFEANRSIAADMERIERRLGEYAEVMIRVALDGAEGVGSESLVIAMQYVGAYRPSAYESSGWADLLGSGGTTILSDPELRRALAGFYRNMEFRRDVDETWQTLLAEARHESRALLPLPVRVSLREAFPGSFTADFPSEFLPEAVNTEALARSIGESPTLTHRLLDVAGNRVLRAGLLRRDAERIDEIIDLLNRSRGAL